MWYLVVLMYLTSTNALLVIQETTLCHQTTEFKYNGTNVNCANRGLSRVPTNLPVNTTILILESNKITILYDNDFQHLDHLREIYLGFNSIKTIQVLSFRGLSSLLVLKIYGHDLNYMNQSLPDDVFRPLASLERLQLRSDMSRFPFHEPTIPDAPFRYLHNLVSLDIDTTSNTVFGIGFSNLTYLKNLTLGNGLGNINNRTFDVFTNSPVETLMLTDFTLFTLENNSLVPFHNLKKFYFSGTLYLAKLQYLIDQFKNYSNINMSEIVISYVSVVSVSYGRIANVISFASISNICLHHLDLSNNRIVLIDIDAMFSYPASPLLKCLKSLNLSHNLITGKFPIIDAYFMNRFSNLESFDVSIQGRLALSTFDPRHTGTGENVTIQFPMFLPPKIKYFNMASVSSDLLRLADAYFFNVPNIRYLNLSNNGLWDFNHRLVGLETLQTLDFSGNDLSIFSSTFFKTFPNLTILRMSSGFLSNDFMSRNSRTLFAPLNKLKHLDLSNNRLVYLPFDIFDSLPNLIEVILAYNSLITIPDVSNLYHLRYLHLDYNSLTTINNQYRQMLDTANAQHPGFNIFIYGNTFSCTCESSGFLSWLEETSVNLDGRNYSCMDMDGKMTTTKAINEKSDVFNRKCFSSFWMIAATVGFSFLSLFIITTFVFINNKMKFKILLLRLIGHNVFPRKRGEFVYDAYIIYTTSTLGLTFNEFRTELELKRDIKLNLRDRDHLPGGYEPDDIQNAIRDSWKVILFVTDEFLRTDLAFYIMCTCLSAITLTTPNRLILVVDNQARIPVNIDFLLEAVSQDNIVYIDIQQHFTDIFWNNLHRIVLMDVDQLNH